MTDDINKHDLPLSLVKVRPGRPSKYRPEFCDRIIDVAMRGGFVAAMCLEIGLRSEKNFFDWTKKFPEFGVAYETTKLISKAMMEEKLMMMIDGRIKGDYKALALLMNNKFKEEYRRVHPQESGTNIHIEQLNTVNTVDLDEKIRQLSSKVGLIKATKEDDIENDY